MSVITNTQNQISKIYRKEGALSAASWPQPPSWSEQAVRFHDKDGGAETQGQSSWALFWDSRMEIKVNFLDKLRLEAKFDDFTVVADQPIRYKGDGSAPGPFDYFLASSALCAAYFVKLYCDTRNIPCENIRLSQNNIVDPENRYQQIFKIQVELPGDISARDRQGILRSIDRWTVKMVVQTGPGFVIEEVENLDADAQALLTLNPGSEANTYIAGKDLPLEQTITNMSGILADLGINAYSGDRDR